MQTADEKVVALAQKIAKLMYSAGDRSDALDAHDIARTFYRRMSIPCHPQTDERLQSKKRSLSKTL